MRLRSRLWALGARGFEATGLSQEMMWVIIIGVIAILVSIGCLVAFCMGKRAATKATGVVSVGRPALRGRSSRGLAIGAAEREGAPAAGAQPPPTTAPACVGDVRLIELGMAVERQRAAAAGTSASVLSAAAATISPPGLGPRSPPRDAADIALKLDELQSTIDNVRESLSGGASGGASPRSPRSAELGRRNSLARSLSGGASGGASPRSPRDGAPTTVDTRIRPINF